VRRVARRDASLGAFMTGASVATGIALLNYINSTDAWIWLCLSLPLVALSALESPRRDDTTRAMTVDERQPSSA
jgi:hypothetical protein